MLCFGLTPYETLADIAHRSNREIRTATYVFIMVVSEGLRFLEWKEYVHNLLENGLESAADTGRKFSCLFQKWDSISKRAQKGLERFEVKPEDQFHNFGILLRNIYVALRA